ncbi:MAG TPA: glycosyltransferase [bacterium]|nr:glycosyltransferase [bacterium]
MANVTLLAAPWFVRDPLPVQSNNLGLGYCAAALENAGHQVTVIDAVAAAPDCFARVRDPRGAYYRIGLPYPRLLDRLPADSDWFGLTVPFTMHARVVREFIPLLKARFPGRPVVLGGVYPSTLPELARTTGADYLVLGEGEAVLPRLIAGEPPAMLPGVWAATQPDRMPLPPQPLIDLDALPFPARHLLPTDRYLARSQRGKRQRSLSLISSRGCPLGCRFCSIAPVLGKQWRGRSADNVLAEIRELIARYAVDHLEFEDDNLTFNRARALAIFRGMAALPKRLTWSSDNGLRYENLDDEMAQTMRAAGCTRIGLGIEHGAPAMLAALGKSVDPARLAGAIAACHRAGITVSGFFIVGHPQENDAHVREAIACYRRLQRGGLGPVAVHLLKPYPATPLWTEALQAGWLTDPDPESPQGVESVHRLRRNHVLLLPPGGRPRTVLARRNRAVRALNPRIYLHDLAAAWRPLRPSGTVYPAAPWHIGMVPLKYAPALGGVERNVGQQAQLLTNAGHQVSVFTTALNGGGVIPGLPAHEDDAGIALHRFPVLPLPLIKYPLIGGLQRALRHSGCDLLHAHSFWYHNLYAAQRARRRCGMPLIVQPHFDRKRARFCTAYQRLLGQWLLDADMVIFVSRWEEQLVRDSGLPVGRSVILPHAVDANEFAAAVPLPEGCGLAGRRYALTVGRVDAGKGIATLLALARRLREARSDLLLAVAGPDIGGALPRFRAQTAADGLDAHLRFLGPVPRADLVALYRHAWCCLHASRYEAFGIVFLEAMAAGLPIVAAANSAVPEVVSDGETGLLYPTDDDAAAYDRLLRLEREPTLHAALGTAGRACVAARHTLPRYRDALLDIYRMTLEP